MTYREEALRLVERLRIKYGRPETEADWRWLIDDRQEAANMLEHFARQSAPQQRRRGPVSEETRLKMVEGQRNRRNRELAQDSNPPLVVATAPHEIYLNISDEPDAAHEQFCDWEVTWCSEPAVNVNVKYVRADLASPPAQPDVEEFEHYRSLVENDSYRKQDEQIRSDHGWKRDSRELPALVQELADRAQPDVVRDALQRLHDLIWNGNAPHWPNLPQTDLASQWYVTVAEAIEREYAALQQSAQGKKP